MITTSDTFRSYASQIKDIYNNWPKVTGEGSNITLTPVRKGLMKVNSLKGDTFQATSILPEGYTQLDYIESTGTQYIDTGVNADNNLRVVLDMQYTDITVGNNTNIGVIYKIDGTTTYKRYHLLVQSTSYKFYVGGGQKELSSADTNRHTFDFDVPNQSIKVDSTEYTIGQQNFDCELNFWLFGRNSNVSYLIFCSSVKLYRSKMYYNGVLVRDFIPCKNSSNVVGLYDLVNNVFYDNDGTGDFTAGNTVSIPNPDFPQDIQIVTGSQTINIGNTTKTLDLGNIKLYGIGDYKDTIFKNTTDSEFYNAELDLDSWYIENNIKKTVLNGTETWNFQSVNSVGLLNVRTGVIASTLTGNNFNGKTNRFTQDLTAIASTTREGFNNSGANYFYIRIKTDRVGIVEGDTNAEMVNKFKAWLSNNNVTVVNALETPTYTKITDTTLIEQLEEIEELHSTDNTTTISITGTLPVIINASALKKGGN